MCVCIKLNILRSEEDDENEESKNVYGKLRHLQS